MEKELTIKGFAKVLPAAGMWLTNGSVVSDGIFTPKDADLSIWREVDDEEKAQIEAEQAALAEQESMDDDKKMEL